MELRLSFSAGAFRTTPVEDLSLWGCNCGGEEGEEKVRRTAVMKTRTHTRGWWEKEYAFV